MQHKKCKDCGQRKRLDQFSRDYSMRDGHRNDCKVCRGRKDAERARQRYREDDDYRARRLAMRQDYYDRNSQVCMEKAHDAICKKKYGITFTEAVRRFGDRCNLCGLTAEEVGLGRVKRLHIDHCHATGKVRGLLCIKCNTGLGCFNDDLDLLRAAGRYLRR